MKHATTFARRSTPFHGIPLFFLLRGHQRLLSTWKYCVVHVLTLLEIPLQKGLSPQQSFSQQSFGSFRQCHVNHDFPLILVVFEGRGTTF